MKLKQYLRAFPIPGCISVAVTSVILLAAVSLLRKVLPEGMAFDFAKQVVNILWPFALTALLGYGWCCRHVSFPKTLTAGLFALILYGAVFLIRASEALVSEATPWKTAPGICLGIISILGIGFREETVFRGIIANNLGIAYGKSQRGVWKAVILSGLIFGLSHLSNIFTGVNPLRALLQTASACAIGMYLSAVYYRGGSLWALVLIHCLTDAGGLFRSAFTAEATAVEQVNSLSVRGLVMIPVFIGITVFLLRKTKMDAVLDNLKQAARCDG